MTAFYLHALIQGMFVRNFSCASFSEVINLTVVITSFCTSIVHKLWIWNKTI